MTSPRKPTAGFWITVALVAVFLYVLSAGPVARFQNYVESPIPDWAGTAINVIYWPLSTAAADGPAIIHVPLRWYLRLWGASWDYEREP